jgi:ABC-type transport system involved in multi-copper enzyme maturation permease subunit
MITQTIAIFVDAYRELNAKKMFWVVLILSVVVVAIFAAVGVKNGELTLLIWQTPIPILMDRAELYRFMFTQFGIGFWLTFIATILALISTASIFPDFISGGSIDLYLSKPMGRLRLFATKYAAGLLFAALQVFVFSLACFLVIGIRGGEWEPRVFLAVPVVVIFFSYLFCIATLVGVMTRSTVAAILLTMLAWFLMFVIGTAEIGLLTFKTGAERRAKQVAPQQKMIDGQLAYIEKLPPEQQAEQAEHLAFLRNRREELKAEAGGNGLRNIRIAHSIVYGVKTVLPKTSDTTDLLSRWLLSERTLQGGLEDGQADDGTAESVVTTTRPGSTQPSTRRMRNEGPISPADTMATVKAVNSRPVSWVIGTSLGFEAVVLALAAWIFCRRDY